MTAIRPPHVGESEGSTSRPSSSVLVHRPYPRARGILQCTRRSASDCWAELRLAWSEEWIQIRQFFSGVSLVFLTPGLGSSLRDNNGCHLAIIDPCSQLSPKLDQSIRSLLFAPNLLPESVMARVRPVIIFLIRSVSPASGRFLPQPSLKYVSNQTSSSLLKGSWINSMLCLALPSPSFSSRMLPISCSNKTR